MLKKVSKIPKADLDVLTYTVNDSRFTEVSSGVFKGSISFANALWNGSLDYIEKNNGQVYKMDVPPSLSANTVVLADGILTSLVIREYQAIFDNEKIPPEVFKTEWKNRFFLNKDHSSTEGYWLLRFRGPVEPAWKLGLADEDLGSIMIPALKKDAPITQARLQGVYEMVSELQPLARGIVQTIHPDWPDPVLDKEAVIRAIQKYNDRIAPLVPNILSDQESGYKTNFSNFISQARTRGALFAGAYYWSFSGFTEMMHKIADNEPKYHEGDEALLHDLYDKELGTALESSVIVLNQARQKITDKEYGSAGSNGVKKIIDKWSNETFGEVTIKWMADKLSSGDPIMNLANMGRKIIGVVEVGVIGSIVLKAGVDAADEIGGFWGKAADGATGGFKAAGLKFISSAAGMVTPLLMLCLLPIFCMGISMAFYLPAMPVITWITAVVGWLLFVMETVFAAPLWAVAHSLPEGDGIAGSHGRQGYMMLLGVLARLPLMVAGFIAAVIVMPIVGMFTGALFKVYTNTMLSGQTPGILTTLCMMFLVGFVMVMISHKVFKLVTHLPDTVTKWVGQTVQNLGEDHDVATQKQMFTGAVGKFEGAAGGAMRGGTGGGKSSLSKQSKGVDGGDKQARQEKYSPGGSGDD